MLDPRISFGSDDRGLVYEKKGDKTQALRDFKRDHAPGFSRPLLLKKLREGGEIL